MWGYRREMRIGTIIVLVVVALFLLLPIISGRAPIPGDLKAREIGLFLGGLFGYWLDAFRTMFSALGMSIIKH